MDARQQRGFQIAKSMRVYFNGKAWIVPSQTEAGTYTVDLNTGVCSCADYSERQLPCKHVHAARWSRDHRDELDVSEAQDPPRLSYPQRWCEYNAAQTIEKGMVQALLMGLCEGIVQPPYVGRGRPPLPLADVVYACGMYIYGGLSSRRSTTDIEECKAKGHIDHAPHFNSIGNYLRREELTPLLTTLIENSAAPLAAVEHDFAVDATGFSTTTYDRWFDKKWGKERKRQTWVKLHASCGVATNVVAAVKVTDGNANDCPEMPGLVQNTAERFDVREVSGDKAYLSHDNLAAIEAVGAVPYVSFKVNSKGEGSEAWRRMWLTFQLERDKFLASYHKRGNAESTFSAIKRKLGASVCSKDPTAQRNEVLTKVLVYNLTVLTHSIHELGIDTGFT